MSKIDPRIGQRIAVGFHGLTAPDYILEWLNVGRVGGIILFARNIDNPQQVADLTRSLHEASTTPLLIGIDQEGGMVARMHQSQGFTESPGAMALSATQDSETWTEKISYVLADEMSSVGINWTYAPSVDLSYNAENPTVGTRSFGRDPETVGTLAAKAVEGFQSGGVVACAKHFPGLGDTAVDSHLALPVLATPVDNLIENDLIPYQKVIEAGIDSIMTTHTIFSTLDEDLPATLSPVIINTLLRDRLRYDGLVITDCLEMHAISKNYGEGESAVLGMIAGVDMLLISHTRSHQETAFEAVEEAVKSGRISQQNLDDSYRRIMAVKEKYQIKSANIDPEKVGTDSNFKTALDSAKSSISVSGKLPDISGKSVGFIEFGGYTDSVVMEQDKQSNLLDLAQQKIENLTVSTAHSQSPTPEQIAQAKEIAEKSDILVVATRNAHIYDAQRTTAQELLANHSNSVLVSLRNPYDEDVIEANATVCTFGDSEPSLEAVILLLAGDYQATGKRPIVAEV